MSRPGSASKSSTVAPTSSSSSEESDDDDAPQELLLDEDEELLAPHFELVSSASVLVSVDVLASLVEALAASPLASEALRASLAPHFDPVFASVSVSPADACAPLAPHFDSVSVLASVVLSVLIVRNRRRHARRAG
jgi:hypothetical protein